MVYVDRKNITFVTAFFDLGKFEKNASRRQLNSYLQNFKWLVGHKFIDNLTVFIEQSNKEELMEIINEYKSPNLTVSVITKEITDLTLYKRFDEMTKIVKKNPTRLGYSVSKDTASYSLVNCSKLELLKDVINQTTTTHYAWIDFGIRHIHDDITKGEIKIPEYHIDRLPIMGDKIHIPIVLNKKRDSNDYYKYRTILGGFFAGSKENILKFYDVFNLIMNEKIDNGIVANEEYLLIFVLEKYPDLFTPYFCNYTCIFRNCVYPLGESHVIELMLDCSFNLNDFTMFRLTFLYAIRAIMEDRLLWPGNKILQYGTKYLSTTNLKDVDPQIFDLITRITFNPS